MKKKIGLEQKINKLYDDYELDVIKTFDKMKDHFLKVAAGIGSKKRIVVKKIHKKAV